MAGEAPIEFDHVHSHSGGVFHAVIDGQRVGRLTYTTDGDDDVVDARSTFVEPSHREHGIAEQLFEQMMTWAKAENLTVIPTCSYIEYQFDRHPDLADLRHQN